MIIDPSLMLFFIFSCVVLCLIPGPNVALIVSNSVAYGVRYGLITLAGTCAAMVPQLAMTTLGMTAVLTGLAAWFEWLRWAGVVYLIWLGISHWRAPVVDLTNGQSQPRSARGLMARAFVVSILNPKTLLFYSAFFPQFVDASRPFAPQVALLSVVCLLVVLIVDSGWAFLAGRARGVLAVHGKIRNRLTGGMLVGAGVGLAVARRS